MHGPHIELFTGDTYPSPRVHFKSCLKADRHHNILKRKEQNGHNVLKHNTEEKADPDIILCLFRCWIDGNNELEVGLIN